MPFQSVEVQLVQIYSWVEIGSAKVVAVEERKRKERNFFVVWGGRRGKGGRG